MIYNVSQIKKQMHELEAITIASIESRIAESGGATNLSFLVFGTGSTIRSILSRARASSPYKIVALLRLLENIEKNFKTIVID